MSASKAPLATQDPPWVKAVILTTVLLFLGLVLVLPVGAVFAGALRQGLGPAFAAIQDPDALSAIRLTLLTAAVAVPFNLVFGLCAAWAVAKHDFPGKALLITLIDLPF